MSRRAKTQPPVQDDSGEGCFWVLMIVAFIFIITMEQVYNIGKATFAHYQQAPELGGFLFVTGTLVFSGIALLITRWVLRK
jgi:ABC-type phosphate transport system permease subunit